MTNKWQHKKWNSKLSRLGLSMYRGKRRRRAGRATKKVVRSGDWSRDAANQHKGPKAKRSTADVGKKVRKRRRRGKKKR